MSESFGAAVFHVYDPSLLSEYESRISGLFCFVLPTQRNIGFFSTVQTTEVNGANDFIVFFIFFKKTFSIKKIRFDIKSGVQSYATSEFLPTVIQSFVDENHWNIHVK